MQLMYPSAVDRHRIIQQLLKAERRTSRLISHQQGRFRQEALARRTLVSQATISNLENLTKKPVRRAELLKVVSCGLEMPQDTIDPILWLFDGCPLNADEIRGYVRGYLPEAQPRIYDAGALRAQVLKLLEEVRKSHFESGNAQDAKIQIFSQEQRVEGETAVYDMEQRPGRQRFITEYPPYLFLGTEFVTRDPHRVSSDDVRQTLLSIHEQRIETLHHNLKEYGGCAIFCKTSLQQYFRDHASTAAELAPLQDQITRCISLLESYEYFEIGLADVTPDLELDIKSSEQAMLQGAVGYCFARDRTRQSWGPYYIRWFDEASVLSFFLAFERAWDAIPTPDRTKEAVIRWLRELLNTGA